MTTAVRATPDLATIRRAPKALLHDHLDGGLRPTTPHRAGRRDRLQRPASFGWGLDDIEWLTLNAMKSAFIAFDARLRIINELVKPGFARLRAWAAAELTTG